MRRLNFSSRSFYILILCASDRYNNGSDLIVQRNCPLLTVLSNLCENLWNCVEIFLLNLLARLILKYSSRTWHEKWNIFVPYFDCDAYLLHDDKNFIRIFSIYYFTSMRIDECVERIYSINKINITFHVYYLNIVQYIHLSAFLIAKFRIFKFLFLHV